MDMGKSLTTQGRITMVEKNDTTQFNPGAAVKAGQEWIADEENKKKVVKWSLIGLAVGVIALLIKSIFFPHHEG
jgi:hypothetical protein